MRTIVISSLFGLAAMMVWLVGARSLGLLIDRLHTARITAEPVHQIRYDSGTIEIAGVRLDTLTTATLPSGLTAVAGAAGRVSFTYHGLTFPCGPGRSVPGLSGLPDIAFSPDPGDSAIFTREQSHLSWPTPLQLNFMTGSAPSWKRHQYCRLRWTKRSGASLEILWRIEQGFFQEDGWRPSKIEFVSAGLLRATITEAADGSGELIAAIHRKDETNPLPGTDVSVNLVLDYQSRRVTRAIAFQ